MIDINVNENIEMTMVGILQSACFIAFTLDQPGYARDLIDAEIFDCGLADIKGCKEICKKHGVEMPRNVWKEKFRNPKGKVA